MQTTVLVFICNLWMMRAVTLLILGHEVKVKFGTLDLCKNFGCNIDNSFSPITNVSCG